MDRALRQRLVGAAVLVGLAVIFLPMLLDESVLEEPRIVETNIPPPPTEEFSSKIVPLDPVQPVTPLDPPPPAPNALPQTVSPLETALQTAEVAPAGDAPEPPEETPVKTTAGTEGGADQRLGVTAWVVQLGSFASEQNARELEKRLRREGYAAFVEKLTGEEGTKSRVRIGPELIRAKAQETRDKLEKDLNLKGIVVRYP